MKTLVIGASAGLGRALAEELARRGHDLFLTASDQTDLIPLAADLSVRFRVAAHIRAEDLTAIDPAALHDDVITRLGSPDNLIYVAGQSFPDDRGPIGDDMAMRLMEVNFSAGVRIVNAFLSDMTKNPDGNIVGMGSVASCRGRRSNSIYGAAKRGLDFYFETLRHYLAAEPCQTQFYRLGYLKTRMTQGQKLPFPVMGPEEAARKISYNLGRDIGAAYLPWWWFGITSLMRFMPWPIFRKLDI